MCQVHDGRKRAPTFVGAEKRGWKMAKISARGAKEVARYNLGGVRGSYVVCSDGRLLYRDHWGKFNLIRRYQTIEEAKAVAEAAMKRCKARETAEC